MSSLSNSSYKTIKRLLAAKLDVSAPAASFNSFLLAWFGKCNTILTLSLIWLSGSG